MAASDQPKTYKELREEALAIILNSDLKEDAVPDDLHTKLLDAWIAQRQPEYIDYRKDVKEYDDVLESVVEQCQASIQYMETAIRGLTKRIRDLKTRPCPARRMLAELECREMTMMEADLVTEGTIRSKKTKISE
jgi:hypothetical protein